jgi:hypothetical protein
VGPTVSDKRERERRTASGRKKMGCGLVSLLGRKGRPGALFIFFSFFPFSFLFSYFLYNFCILNSTDFKPIAKVF